jgi:hypothetical protein
LPVWDRVLNGPKRGQKEGGNKCEGKAQVFGLRSIPKGKEKLLKLHTDGTGNVLGLS